MATTAQKLLAACKVINQEAIAEVARLNGVTIAFVLDRISYGDSKCIAQVKTLIDAGMKKAIEMHGAGEISLI